MSTATSEPTSPSNASGMLVNQNSDQPAAKLYRASFVYEAIRDVRFYAEDGNTSIDAMLATARQRNMSFKEDRKRQHTPSTANRSERQQGQQEIPCAPVTSSVLPLAVAASCLPAELIS